MACFIPLNRQLAGQANGHQSSRSSNALRLGLAVLLASICLTAPQWSRAGDEATAGDQAPASGATQGPTQTPPQESPSLETTAQNQQPAFYVHAELDRPTKDFREGDALALRVTCEIDAFLYILYQQADGKVYQIFPNTRQPNNRVPAKQTVQVPAKDDLFRWVVGPPFGKEVVKVIACRRPVDNLSDAQSRSKRFNPITASRLKDAAGQLAQTPASDWAEVDLEILTYSQEQAPLAQGSRRFGVFFGVSNYQFDQQRRAAVHRLTGKEQGGLNLSACHRDAQGLGRLLRDIGALNDLRIYTDADATRANLEYAVTRWLPSVSRSGDTVFIHFSGHGGQIADDNGDESNDHLDEVLIPHDIVDDLILSQLLEDAKQNRLDSRLAPRVEQLLAVAQRSGDRAREMLMRETGVSDDLFARWLQHLSGRQVVVILDTCHSGGFATQEKGLKGGSAVQAEGFDFLEGEMARLKDIGERDQAMLAAALSAESALELISKENGVLTGFLLESLRITPGPVKLEDSYHYCEQQFPKYFEVINQQLANAGREERLTPHRPLLVNYCSRPVFLKP
jgi:hypothetical protein